MYAPRLGRSPVRPSGGVSGPGGGHSTSAVDPERSLRRVNAMGWTPPHTYGIECQTRDVKQPVTMSDL